MRSEPSTLLIWSVYYDGEFCGVVSAMTAHDAKRIAETDFDIDDICLLRVVLNFEAAA